MSVTVRRPYRGERGRVSVTVTVIWHQSLPGARCSSVVRTFAHGALGRRIDPSWGGPIELFPVPARERDVVRAFAHGAVGRRIDPSWWTH